MTHDQLRAFLAAARFSSFTKAADHLFLNQSSVSRSILALEQELQVKLFTRSSQGLKLTEEGAFFLTSVEPLFEAMETAVRDVRSLRGGAGAAWHVQLQKFNYPAVAPLFRSFVAAYPGGAPQLHFYWSLEGKEIIRQLDTGETDLFFGLIDQIPSSAVGNYRLRRVMTDRLCVLVGRSHPLAGAASVYLSDLAGSAVIAGTHHDPDTDRELREEMARRALQPYVTTRYASEEEMLMHVSAGQGVSFVLSSGCIGAYWDCVQLPFADFVWTKDLYMIWSEDNQNPSLKRFLNFR